MLSELSDIMKPHELRKFTSTKHYIKRHAYLYVQLLPIREETLKIECRNPSKSRKTVLNFPFCSCNPTRENVHRFRSGHRCFPLVKVQFSLIFHLLIKLLRLSFVYNEKFNFLLIKWIKFQSDRVPQVFNMNKEKQKRGDKGS